MQVLKVRTVVLLKEGFARWKRRSKWPLGTYVLHFIVCWSQFDTFFVFATLACAYITSATSEQSPRSEPIGCSLTTSSHYVTSPTPTTRGACNRSTLSCTALRDTS